MGLGLKRGPAEKEFDMEKLKAKLEKKKYFEKKKGGGGVSVRGNAHPRGEEQIGV